MKKIKSLSLVITFMISGFVGKAQTINWAALRNDKQNTINITIGVDHSVAYGLSYGRSVKVLNLLVIAGAEFFMPSGEQVLDDFKSKIGGHIQWVNFNGFRFSTRIQGVFRRNQNDFVRMLNFGSDLAAVAGFYQSKWFIAGEAGFDKAIVTHFKHTELYRTKYADVVDGWYEPATGGNFYYGIQAGVNFKSHGISLKGGYVLSQDFKTKPLVPYYAQVGYSLNF